MATYAYKAMDETGKISKGQLVATTIADLEARLKRMDLDLIRARLVTPARHRLTRIPRRDLIDFCFHMEQLIRAGVPLLDALLDLRDSMETLHFRNVVAEVANSIESGASLSQALMRHPHVFDSVFLSLIAAGEHAGKLPEVLRDLTDALKWQDELTAQTKRLMLYPAFLGTLVATIFLFLLVYLVPKMAGFIANLGQALPLHTRILLATSDFLVRHWQALAMGAILTTIVTVLLIQAHPQWREQWDGAKLRLPLIGNVLRKIILSRIASVLALMYSAGISVLDALHVIGDVAGNRIIGQGLKNAEQQIRDGQRLAMAFQNTGLFPPLVIRMLHVGENTGALDTALSNVAYFYSRDAKESVARMQVLLEPILTVIIGALLGWIMLAVLGPIYDAISALRV
ncbi:MAG TPA: type II secretion system F family protein [Rhodocyclaceae bacterium]|nr:type II secretion system F family protein [Rhodocyclaceae bacterium]